MPRLSRRLVHPCAYALGLLLVGCGSSATPATSNAPPTTPGSPEDSGESTLDATSGASDSAGTVDSSGGAVETGTKKKVSGTLSMRVAPSSTKSATATLGPSITAGSATAVGLEQLKYYITSIQICETAVTSGSAVTSTSGCLELYSKAMGAYAYSPTETDFRPHATTARGSDEGFVDLMNPTSRAALMTTTTLRASDARSYTYGIVYWALPIKVKATLAMNDGTTLFTHDGTTTRTVMSGGYVHYETVASKLLTVSPAEPAVILHQNGGTWFKFQSPLRITAADVEAEIAIDGPATDGGSAEGGGGEAGGGGPGSFDSGGGEIADGGVSFDAAPTTTPGPAWDLDLIFNPDGIVKASTFGGRPPQLTETGDSPKGITVPMLDLVPIPHRRTDSLVKETYRASISSGTDRFDVRLELYSVAGDATRTIYGADVKSLVVSTTTTSISDFDKIASIATNSDGTLTFRGWDPGDSIASFTRRSTVGETTTATIRCRKDSDYTSTAAITFESCPAGGTVSATFTLQAKGAP